jgi:glucose/arabinose dehydrogenase
MRNSIFALSFLSLLGCTTTTNMAPTTESEFGSSPSLVEPDPQLIPTAKIAKAIGFDDGIVPRAADGWRIQAFAQNLQHPRWLLDLPNGDILVAETDAPKGSGGFAGIKGLVAKFMMRRGGSNLGSANQIRLLRDTDSDGEADVSSVLIDNLHSPFGMAYSNGNLYVANTDSLVRFKYTLGATGAASEPVVLTELPSAPFNHHWTKSLILDESGENAYIGVGSNSNIAENGMKAELNRAAILRYNLSSGELSLFASGLRNPVGMAWHPATKELWTVVNERDELGDQLVPDYLTRVTEGGFYGWPLFYMGGNVDARVEAMGISEGRTPLEPDYALGAHTASLGLDFYDHKLGDFTGAAIIGQRGSWNRSEFSGYKVIAVPFNDGQAKDALPITLLDGFLTQDGKARGRPVGIEVLRDGSILVADDVANTVWRLSPKE